MLVRELDDGLQIVLQPDHGVVAGQLAAAWDYGRALSAELREALVVAARRHDDGWSVWERHPRIGEQGRPQSFLDAPLEPLLSSYTACADVVCHEHPLAGLLVSMHISGLRRGRYGVFSSQPEIGLEELDGPVREFVAAEEERQRTLIGELGLPRPKWAYRLLQVFDVLSLHLGLDCTAPRTIEAPDEGLVPDGAPVGARRPLRLSPTGAPWQLACEPYPFRADALIVRMVRRVLSRRAWEDDAGFRAAFRATSPETVEISLVPARA